MFTVRISEKGGAERQTNFDKAEVTIGRIQQNDVVLPKGNVSKHHSRVVLKDGRFLVVDLKSTNGTYVNGKRISTPTVVKPGDKIYIGDFILTVDKSGAQQPETTEAPKQPSISSSLAAPPAMSPSSAGSSAGFASSPDPSPPAMSSAIAPPSFGSSSAGSGSEEQPNVSVPPPLPRRSPTSEPSVASESAANAFGLGKEPPMVTDRPPPEPLPERPPAHVASQPPPSQPPPSRSSNFGGPDSQQIVGARVSQPSAPPINVGPGEQGALRAVMHQLEARFDVHNVAVDGLHDTNRRAQAQTEIDTIISELTHAGALGPELSMDTISKLAVREAVGLGCLEALLADDAVSEVCVNGPSDICIDRGSGPTKSDLFVSSAKMLATLGRRLIAQTRASDDRGPVLEGTLPYGPRVTVLLSPVAPRGPVVEIRRMGESLSIDDLVSSGVLSREAADMLLQAVESRVNVAVVGELGSGVTTLLGALASSIGAGERVICVEDVADMQVRGPQVVSLTAGDGSLVDSIRYSAKLRGDRLIVDGVGPAECEAAIVGVGARPGGCLLGIHTTPGDDPGEPLRRMTQGNETIKHLLPQVAPIVVGLDRRTGVTSVVETLKTKSTILFVREGNALEKKSDPKVL